MIVYFSSLYRCISGSGLLARLPFHCWFGFDKKDSWDWWVYSACL